MTAYTQTPSILVLNTEDAYKRFVDNTQGYIVDPRDVNELFNQAIDFITEPLLLKGLPQHAPHLSMLRDSKISQSTIVTSNGMTIYSMFNMLCKELIDILIDLRATPIIDYVTGNEVYPYYFLKMINGNVVFKRL